MSGTPPDAQEQYPWLYGVSLRMAESCRKGDQCRPKDFTLLLLTDHPQSGVVYNFGRVCLSVCQTITFESLDVGSLYLHIRYISREYGSNSYMKVTGSTSRLHKQKDVENSHSSNVKLRSAIIPVLYSHNIQP